MKISIGIQGIKRIHEQDCKCKKCASEKVIEFTPELIDIIKSAHKKAQKAGDEEIDKLLKSKQVR